MKNNQYPKTQKRYAVRMITWLLDTDKKRIGELITIDGIVTIAQYSDGKDNFTNMNFVHNGYRYRRWWKESLTKYQLVRRANKLVADAINNEVSE